MMTLPTYGDEPHRLALTLVRLMRSDHGQLKTNNYRERVARAALLIDWAATGRLVDGVTAVELDTNPTGNPGADAFLAAVERKPNQPLQYWLSAVRIPVVHGLAQRLCDLGACQPSKSPLLHRYRDPHAEELAALRLKLEAVREDLLPVAPEIIALAMLDRLVTPYPQAISMHLVNEYRCGQLTWVTSMVREYFEQALLILSRGTPTGNFSTPTPGL